MRSFLPLFLMTALLSCSGKPPRNESSERPSDLPPPPMLVVPADMTPPVANPSAGEPVKPKPKSDVLSLEEVQAAIGRFHPVKLTYPQEELTEDLLPVVAKLIEAARAMDEIFLLQVSPENPARLSELRAAVEKDATQKPLLDYFIMMYGPWDRLDHNKPFWGTARKPAGAGFYDAGITRQAFETHLSTLEAALAVEKDRIRKNTLRSELDGLKSLFTVVDRKDGAFVFTPYHEKYKEPLARAVAAMEEAAKLTQEPTLRRYLTLRAKALQDDRYQESDFAWLDLKGPIEFLIGPYEVYEDGLMGYRAAYEAFVNLIDRDYSARLAELKSYRKDLDEALPYDAKFRSSRGKDLPIVVVNQLFTAGDTRAGVQTMAFNLPNDEEVRRKKGFKLVLFKNIAQAKFEAVLMPIAKTVINPAQIEHVTFDAFFTHTLYHEITHGLGPAFLKVDRKEVEVRTQLKEYYAANEEAKADVGGLVGLEAMANVKKKVSEAALKAGYVTFVASIFRSIRFGSGEAHGKANLMAFNYLVEQKAVVVDPATLTVTVAFDRMPQACRDFVAEILKIQIAGDPEAAAAFEKKYAELPQSVKKITAKLDSVPVDIATTYAVLERLK
ncbi:peptidase [Myxococcota bacterium]|nr:peptidase [Myxococcota bacterium]MBU1413805.1 peptidase [Myxococcota bacterium]MBU1510332.1 peptidase [Myxococcota bacterium]